MVRLFAAALRMPNQTAPPLLLTILLQASLHDFVRGGELLISGDLLYRCALLNFEDDEVTENVEQVSTIKQPVNRAAHPVRGGYVVMGRGITPFVPQMELISRNAIPKHELVHASAKHVRVVQLGRFTAVPSTLLGPLCPVDMPVPARCLRLHVGERNPVTNSRMSVRMLSFGPSTRNWLVRGSRFHRHLYRCFRSQ